jgi:tRNA pseudouridine55 synthase
MHGILVIDKPQGLTSHTVVQRVRHTCKVKRVGHAGTLDPLATGLLIIGVGKCTRLIEYLVASEKSYRATFVLGKVTDSQDITGEVISEDCVAHITADMIHQTCAAFVGTIEQVPPMFSALKQNGVPLYRLARQGVEVERQKRSITISRLNVEHIDADQVTIAVDCSKGTYIRTLCHDIGQQLGCGACMTSLRRIRSGCFDESMAIGMDALADGDFQLLPATAALQTMIHLNVATSGRERLMHGIPPFITDLVDASMLQDADQVALYFDDKLLAIASYDPEHQLDERGDFKLVKVFPDGI